MARPCFWLILDGGLYDVHEALFASRESVRRAAHQHTNRLPYETS